MITFKDFLPRPHVGLGQSHGGLGKPAQAESFREAVAAANHWMEQNVVRPLNVETVLLPGTSVTTSPAIVEDHDHQTTTRWIQFVRVWYEAKELAS